MSEAMKSYALDAIVRGWYTLKKMSVFLLIIGMLIIFTKCMW